MNRQGSKQLVHGAILLSLAGFIAKGLGAGYRIILQNLAGDEAVYVYQQIYPFLAFALILSLYGFPSAIAALTQDKRDVSWRTFIKPIFVIVFIISTILGLVLYLLAPVFSNWISDENLLRNYQAVALVFIMLPFVAVFRGVYQGRLSMAPIATSQVIEQLIRVSIIITGAWLIYIGTFGMYSIGQIAITGSLAGSVGAILTLSFYRNQLDINKTTTRKTPWRTYALAIVVIAFTATLNHSVLVLMQVIDSVLIVPQLLESGYSFTEAVLEKGIYDRGQPLIQIGSVIGSSFALAVLPFVSQNKLNEIGEELEGQIHTSLKCSFMLSLGATIGLVGLLPHVNQMLFKNTLGTDVLQLLMLAILFGSLLMTGVAILQGLDSVKETAFYMLIGVMMKVLFNYILTPIWGTLGSAFSTVISLVITTVIVLFRVRQALPSRTLFGTIKIWRPFSHGITFLVLFTYLFRQIGFWLSIESRMLLFGYIILASALGAVGYLWILIRNNLFTEKEIQILPFRSLFEKLKS